MASLQAFVDAKQQAVRVSMWQQKEHQTGVFFMQQRSLFA
jgi:hypothetical protein